MHFRPEALRLESGSTTTRPTNTTTPIAFPQLEAQALDPTDFDWICEHLVLEIAAPPASLDLTAPGPAEQLLIHRVQTEVGAGVYPNADRAPVDVAEALIRCARAARQGSPTPTATELLRRTQLRTDFGAVARANPVDHRIAIPRSTAVASLVQQVTAAARDGHNVLLVGPPGQGKSWLCHQLLACLSANAWLVAEHYCYLGHADGHVLPRVRAESVFGSLLRWLSEHEPDLVADQRPRFAADEQALENAVTRALRTTPDRPVALVVDGLDHVTRIAAAAPGDDPSLLLAEALAALRLPPGSTLIVLSQAGAHLALRRPQFSWTRIRGESDVKGGGGHGWVEASAGSGVGADGGSPEGDRSRRRRRGGWGGGLGARAAVEREPETGRGSAAAARRVA